MYFKPFPAFIVAFTMVAGTAPMSMAQTLDCTLEANARVAECFCNDVNNPLNQESPICLSLPEERLDITNFAPLIAPLLGAGALAGLAGGGSTTSTTSTN
jgi:hypothetical protein